MIELKRAVAADASLLTKLSRQAFDADVDYGAPGPGGPPGYDDLAWQERAMQWGDYYVITCCSAPIGGIIAYATDSAGSYELGRIFIAPEWQNRGLGRKAMELLWPLYPQAIVWHLDTPAWNLRTRHFYAQLGFVETRVSDDGTVFFERKMPAPAPDPA